MADSSKVIDDYNIREFIETLTPPELVQLYKSVTSPEFVGLIADELKKGIPNNSNILQYVDVKAFVKLWKQTNSPGYLVGISDELTREVEAEVAEMMGEVPTHG